jgi:hypothetical protein
MTIDFLQPGESAAQLGWSLDSDDAIADDRDGNAGSDDGIAHLGPASAPRRTVTRHDLRGVDE